LKKQLPDQFMAFSHPLWACLWWHCSCSSFNKAAQFEGKKVAHAFGGALSTLKR
jgi:hypothetical protein